MKTQTNKGLDYTNLKETLKDLQDGYNKSNDDEEKYDILKNYNVVLEEFIDLFDKNFDNETMVEKYYIYVKELINSYIKTLNMKICTNEDKQSIIEHIKGYIKIFALQNSGYLDSLLEMLKEIEIKTFFEIISVVIEELNNCGKKCIEERKKFCKYNSLKYFEKAFSIFKRYIGSFSNSNISRCNVKTKTKCKSEISLSESYINDINSNAILLSEDVIKSDQLIQSTGSGFTSGLSGLKISEMDEQEKYQIVLANYEKILSETKDKTKEKAICIACIVNIAINYLKDVNYKKYIKLCRECEFIVDELGIDKNERWCKAFLSLYEDVKNSYKPQNKSEMKDMIKKKYKKKFDEIDLKFAKKKII